MEPKAFFKEALLFFQCQALVIQLITANSKERNI